MTGALSPAVAAWLLAAAAVVLIPLPSSTRLPGRRHLPRPHRPGPTPAVRRALLVGAGIAAAGSLLVPAMTIPAVLAGGTVAAWLRRRPVPVAAAEAALRRAALADACRLVAACLSGGMSIGAALASVLDAMWPDDAEAAEPLGGAGSPSEPASRGLPVLAGSARVSVIDDNPSLTAAVDRLRTVASLLALGAEPSVAWQAVRADEDLAALAAAATRSALGGSALAEAVADCGRSLTEAVEAAVQARAGRAGVLIAAPLGLCFLPAFICLGLAPVVLGLLGQLGVQW